MILSLFTLLSQFRQTLHKQFDKKIQYINHFAKQKRLLGKTDNQFDWLDVCILIVICLLCFFIFFQGLDKFPLRMWDESRNAINALEMLRNQQYLSTYFRGTVDLWNTKPPLFIWIVVIFFKLFGVSELSLRLPSAIAASLISMIIYFFSKLLLRNRWVGLLAVLILVSSMGFPDTHIGRTGDYDALLTLLLTCGSIFTFHFLQTNQNRSLYIATIFWILAVLTKGVAGLFMLPGIFIYIFISRKIPQLVRNRAVWKSVIFFGLGVALYYLIRTIVNPGYFSAVLQEEIINRYGSPLQAVHRDIWYYWKNMVEFRFQVWIYFIPPAILTYFFTEKKILKQIILFSYSIGISLFAILSYSQSTNIWYDAPLYPFFSLLTALSIILILQKLPLFLKIFPILILCFYLQRYIRTNYAYVHRHDIEKIYSCINYGYLFRHPPTDIQEYIAVDMNENYCMPLIFYTEKAGVSTQPLSLITPGEKIISCDPKTIEQIQLKFLTKTIYSDEDACVGIIILQSK